MKKIIFVFSLFLFSLFSSSTENKVTITFKELSDFQACYAFMIGSNNKEEKSMLNDWINIKDINCDKYAEVIYRAKILGSIQ